MGERYISPVFRDVVVGQQVVIEHDSWSGSRLEKTTITRIGPTKIWTANGGEFSRTNGREWGSLGNWHPSKIARVWRLQGPETLMTYEEADTEIMNESDEERRGAGVRRLRDTKWNSLTTDQVIRIVALLDDFIQAES